MDDLAFLLVILIVLLLFLSTITMVIMNKVKDRSVYLKNIPGPKPFFFFANYFEFVGGTSVILKKMMNFFEKYGDTILLHDGTLSWVVASIDYEFNELILSSSTHIDKADQYRYLHTWLGQGLLTSTGSKWRSHRKAITPSFHFSILQEYIGIFDNVGDTLINKLKKSAGQESIEISKIISSCTLDIICANEKSRSTGAEDGKHVLNLKNRYLMDWYLSRDDMSWPPGSLRSIEAAMGIKMNSMEHESTYIKNIKTECLIITQRMFTPFNNILYPLTWKSYKERKAVKVIHDYVDNVIVKRIEKHQKEENNIKFVEGGKKRLAFLDLLLKSTIDGRPLTKEELRDEVNTFMFEGHDTTASAIMFSLLMIATHPEVQEKVVIEQQHIYGDNLKFARPTYKELNEMKYLESVIKETLRLFPSVPYFGRLLAKDLQFKGNLYPKGMPIIIIPFVFQRNPKYFPEPEKFIPERFKNQTGKLPYSYTPFSAGPRNCIGQRFAMLEMLAIISKIIRNFKLFPANPEHEVQLAPELILISKNGIRVSIENRS